MQPVPPEQGSAKELVFARGSWGVILLVAGDVRAGPQPRGAGRRSDFWSCRFFCGSPFVLRRASRLASSHCSLRPPSSGRCSDLSPRPPGCWRSPGFFSRWPGYGSGADAWLGRGMACLLGAVLLLASPYVISSLGRGITPPARGVSLGLWLIWQLTLLVSVSALIVPAAALFRGDGPESKTRWRIVAGVAIAFAAAIIGILVWVPRGGGWPNWYTFLWTPALLLVTLPASRWATIAGVALVAGSSAALVTWGAEMSGRLQVAQRDIARLGSEPDPLALPLLEGFGEQVLRSPPPASASEMYALWHGSALRQSAIPGAPGPVVNRGRAAR